MKHLVSPAVLSPQAAGHRPAPTGTEGRPDSTERKTQKEVRFDTTEYTGGWRGWAGKEKHKKRYGLTLQSILEGGGGGGRRGKTQREVQIDIAEYTGGRRVPGDEKHKKKYGLTLQGILEGGGGGRRGKTLHPITAVRHKKILYYCCPHRPPGTAQHRRAPGAT